MQNRMKSVSDKLKESLETLEKSTSVEVPEVEMKEAVEPLKMEDGMGTEKIEEDPMAKMIELLDSIPRPTLDK